MVKETVTERIERYRLLSEIFLRDNIKVAIKDVEDNYYFCEILFVGVEKLRIQCFGPTHRQGLKFDLYYPLIIKLEEYKEINK